MKGNLNIALKAARAASKIILENFVKPKTSDVKDDAKGLVTATDLAAEKAILEILAAESDYEILSEESGTTNGDAKKKWVIDPLDGTSNFARSIPLFATSIGLMQGNESLLGVIIDPVHAKEYYATKGNGAFCNGKPMVLPKFETNYIPSLFLNHGYGAADRHNFQLLAARLAADFNILKLGTTAVELCHIASGAVDGFICSGDEIWDFAAGMVIAREAGCLFTDWQGNAWSKTTDHLLVARREVHPRLLELIADLQ